FIGGNSASHHDPSAVGSTTGGAVMTGVATGVALAEADAVTVGVGVGVLLGDADTDDEAEAEADEDAEADTDDDAEAEPDEADDVAVDEEEAVDEPEDEAEAVDEPEAVSVARGSTSADPAACTAPVGYSAITRARGAATAAPIRAWRCPRFDGHIRPSSPQLRSRRTPAPACRQRTASIPQCG
ncbi:MAG: hypothetical protein ACKOW5_14040, partial [Actinomycetales bacterium]